MSYRKPLPPLQVSRDIRALEAFAPIADRWYPAWVEDGTLRTICGPVAHYLPVRYHNSKLAALSGDELGQLRRLLARYKTVTDAATE
jgi:hypothetical protein